MAAGGEEDNVIERTQPHTHTHRREAKDEEEVENIDLSQAKWKWRLTFLWDVGIYWHLFSQWVVLQDILRQSSLILTNFKICHPHCSLRPNMMGR